MARTRIYFRFFFFCIVGIHREKKSRMKDTKGERKRERSLPEAQRRDGMSSEGRMGEGRQVMLGSRHTRCEREREKRRGTEKERNKREEKRDGAQTHVLRILRRARTQFEHTQTRRHFNTRHSCCRAPGWFQLATWLVLSPLHKSRCPDESVLRRGAISSRGREFDPSRHLHRFTRVTEYSVSDRRFPRSERILTSATSEHLSPTHDVQRILLAYVSLDSLQNCSKLF